MGYRGGVTHHTGMDENTRRQVEAALQALNRIADALEGPQASGSETPWVSWLVPKLPSELLASVAPEAPQDAPCAPQPPQDATEAPAAASEGSPWRVGPADLRESYVWRWRSGSGAVPATPFGILPGEHYAIGPEPTTPPPAVAGGWTEYRQPVKAEGPYVLIPIGDGGTVAMLRWDLVVSGQPWAPVGTSPGPWPF